MPQPPLYAACRNYGVFSATCIIAITFCVEKFLVFNLLVLLALDWGWILHLDWIKSEKNNSIIISFYVIITAPLKPYQLGSSMSKRVLYSPQIYTRVPFFNLWWGSGPTAYFYWIWSHVPDTWLDTGTDDVITHLMTSQLTVVTNRLSEWISHDTTLTTLWSVVSCQVVSDQSSGQSHVMVTQSMHKKAALVINNWPQLQIWLPTFMFNLFNWVCVLCMRVFI